MSNRAVFVSKPLLYRAVTKTWLFPFVEVCITGNSSGNAGGGVNSYSYDSTATATLSISRSTLSDNKAGGYGGAIENISYSSSANLTVTTCTISSNTADKSGGGIDTYANSGTTTVTASTITGNTAGTNGGGMYSSFPDNTNFTVKHNLISGNQAVSGAELFNNSGTSELGGYNLLGHDGLDTAASFSGIALSPTDVSATSDSGNPFGLNAILTPLANNGGFSLTHALPGGSPALDLAPRSECSTAPFNLDQRGSIRPYGAGCDAGSYEYKSNILLMVVPVLAAAKQP